MARPPLGSLVLVAVLLVAFGLVATVDRPEPAATPVPEPDDSTVTPTREVAAQGNATALERDFPPVVTAGVAALAVVAAALLVRELLLPWLRSRGGSTGAVEAVTDPAEAESPAAEDEDGAPLDEMGAAAGAAADRIEADVGFTNEVYRAYHEMTLLLELDPETTAPDEFADHAAAAGMAPDHVRDLTRLFEEVRYGERDPGSREGRAVDALRRIESAYGPGDGPDGPASPDGDDAGRPGPGNTADGVGDVTDSDAADGVGDVTDSDATDDAGDSTGSDAGREGDR